MKVQVAIEIPALLIMESGEVGIIKGGGEVMVTEVVEMTTPVPDFKLFCENVVKDGLVYASGHWVSPTCVKAIWVVE